MYTVVALALPDVIAFDLATAVETFGRVTLPDGRLAYRVIVAGTAPTVDAGPLQIATSVGLEALERADTIMVPGRNDAAAP
ncbi:AraC family transcriptional regulator, partial [Xanthomonas citri pv. citri]|nr:AraC family transcriptional regulator [Xanthomonas citri pv. citri]